MAFSAGFDVAVSIATSSLVLVKIASRPLIEDCLKRSLSFYRLVALKARGKRSRKIWITCVIIELNEESCLYTTPNGVKGDHHPIRRERYSSL